MGIFNFSEWDLFAIVLTFMAASGLVWFSGTRLSRHADELVKKTGLGRVVVGTLLLGGVTSLPEVATTVTASAIGDAEIAINNLFGGVAMQVTVLAIADITLRERALSSRIGSRAVELQAVIGIGLLSISAVIILIHDIPVAHVGVGSALILLVFVAGFFLISYFESIRWWDAPPEHRTSVKRIKECFTESPEERDNANNSQPVMTLGQVFRTRLFLYLLLSSLAVLIGGYVVVRSGEAIASKTGIGSSLIGAVLVAFSTSLPELSTTLSAVRLKEYKLAFSNIFGTNILTIGLVFIADIFFVEGAILNEVNAFSAFAALLGIIVTAIYLIGLSMRFKRTFLNMGYDSFLVLITYLSGVYIMFTFFDNS